ncbi:PREDICTED: fibulin-5-like, partial [Priapulus caudatus]|uniref:Fibulin-5-like n=1 Tax=Priapulus caudatus TaxID=37621 RepID=A0ABM1EWG8_PRICU
VDECNAALHDCDPNATCLNTVGSFRCECNGRWSGDGVTCVATTEQSYHYVGPDLVDQSGAGRLVTARSMLICSMYCAKEPTSPACRAFSYNEQTRECRMYVSTRTGGDVNQTLVDWMYYELDTTVT